MSMMVNPMSSVSFRATTDATSILERPGKYSNPAPEQQQTATQAAGEQKKSSGTGKKVFGTVATLVVIAGVLAALPKVFPKAIKSLSKEELANAKIMEKVGHYFAKTGETIAKYTYEPVVNLINKWRGKTPKTT